MRRPNDVGVGWKKTNDLGEYVWRSRWISTCYWSSTRRRVDKVNLNMYPIISNNPKAPDYQLKYYPKGGQAPTSTRRDPVPDDDDIPF